MTSDTSNKQNNRNPQKIRDLVTIDFELTKLLGQIKQHRSIKDDPLDLELLNSIGQNSFGNNYEKGENYFKQFWRYYIVNEVIIKQINGARIYNTEVQTFITQLENVHQEFTIALQQRQKKKNRRTAVQIDKVYSCPYEKCKKLYGSDVSLNLHIKLKHGGGNKTDREKQAKRIIQAEDQGENPPSMDIQFPPGYIEQFKMQLQREQQGMQVYQPSHKDINFNVFIDQ